MDIIMIVTNDVDNDNIFNAIFCDLMVNYHNHYEIKLMPTCHQFPTPFLLAAK